MTPWVPEALVDHLCRPRRLRQDRLYRAEQQLGLRLQSTSAPVGVLVIDRIARPSHD